MGVRSQKWKCSGRREGDCLVGHRKGDSHTSEREREETRDPAKGAGVGWGGGGFGLSQEPQGWRLGPDPVDGKGIRICLASVNI